MKLCLVYRIFCIQGHSLYERDYRKSRKERHIFFQKGGKHTSGANCMFLGFSNLKLRVLAVLRLYVA